MKAKEVLNLLGISRSTLSKYVKQGKIKATKLFSGRYEYDDDSVYALLGKGGPRKNVIYVRVFSEPKGKELKKQIELVNQYCLSQGIIIEDIYQDIGSGLDLERPEFLRLVNEVLNYKIKKIFVLSQFRFSLFGFNFFKQLFKYFGVQLISLNQKENFYFSEEEVYKEVIYFLNFFSSISAPPLVKQRLELIKNNLELDLK